jgi:hypothetical protein
MENDRKKIYFVTVFYVPKEFREEMPRPKIDEWETVLYKRIRCWGWFEKEEDAEKCIKENWTDIYELGYYNLAMIEPNTEGPISCGTESRWFDVKYLDTEENSFDNEYIVTEIDKPEAFKSIIGFSYA